MESLYQFGGVKVLFQNLPCDPGWPFWSWKLDPFSVKEGTADITVGYSGQRVLPEGSPLWEDAGAAVIRQVYSVADGGALWQQTAADSGELQLQYVVSADWRRITLTCDNSQTAGVGAFEALTFLIFYAFLRQQVLTFHGALVEEKGRGFLLCAPSGVGKTTHARLWRDRKNALILNGDRAACRKEQGRWIGFGTPWCGTSGEYLNRSVPLGAVVILKRGDENRVTPASGLMLLSHVVYPVWDRKETEWMLSLLDDFLETVPVLQMECTPDVSAVETLYQALEKLHI